MSKRLDDGYRTLIRFPSQQGTVQFWEKSVVPPGVDAGGETDTTTMHNTTWRTKNPKALKTLTEASATCAYDPAVYPDIVAMAGVNQLITVTFPDGDTLAFWGWLDKFTPGDHVEGEQPTADVTIMPSNQSPTNGAETGLEHEPADDE